MYDDAFKGLVSSIGYPPGNSVADYWEHILQRPSLPLRVLDPYSRSHHPNGPTWGAVKANEDWVNSLAKGACNPVNDEDFPFSRNFDWYHGHSWAHGIFEFADGKDLESTSEEAQFAYAIKMWGKVSEDKSMEARGYLMLKILARTLNSYFLLASDNTIMPSKVIGNKVNGILFENKCEHSIFFPGGLDAIHGIHMLPIIPSSTLIRGKKFVQEEWDVYFRTGGAEPVENVSNNWRGVIMANLALIDPKASWHYFIRPDLHPNWLDNGQSRTWSLAMAAGSGGGPS